MSKLELNKVNAISKQISAAGTWGYDGIDVLRKIIETNPWRKITYVNEQYHNEWKFEDQHGNRYTLHYSVTGQFIPYFS